VKIHHRIITFSIISIISVFAGTSLLMIGAVAQQGRTESDIGSPQFLAILNAQSGTIAEINLRFVIFVHIYINDYVH
jgi:hypothetical protein